ncbi:peptidase inhibitor family I36 protein [Streptosporangium sp. 'caverna']|uniref:peptidase inhibitor family I36 protein n=1 Tax=Streptosporangium sp. 'caverna' TaxID=2202249 RepID=UPI0019550987|nr:peptidase inhibitor family I36 protein [Streptosporangium sp. 'caverna']
MRANIQRTRVAAAAAVIGLLCAGFSAPAQAAEPGSSAERSAALQRADENCGNGEICFWHDRNYSGTPWRWTPGSGYRDMPSNLHDHVYSFKANASGCFIDWDPQEKRPVNPGDYAKAYDTNFGKRIDAVGPTC